jgi:hypothetical protein
MVVLEILISSINTITTSQNLTTKAPSQANQSKIKLSYQINGSVPITVYDKNIRRMRGIVKELLSQLYQTFSHILCHSEHHMNHLELEQTFLDSYKLGVSYCRTLCEERGICIFVQGSSRYKSIDLEKYCMDKDFEVCATKIYQNTKSARPIRQL